MDISVADEGWIASFDLGRKQLLFGSGYATRGSRAEQLIETEIIARWAAGAWLAAQWNGETNVSEAAASFAGLAVTRALSSRDSVQRAAGARMGQVLSGSGASANDGSLERLLHARFCVPPGNEIVFLRTTFDGIVMPLMSNGSPFEFFSRYDALPGSIPLNVFREDGSVSSYERSIRSGELRRSFLVPIGIAGRAAKIRLATESYPLPERLRWLMQAGFPSTCEPHAGASGYSVLMFGSARTYGYSGRTGVLFVDGRPCIVPFNGREYLVELKGIGSPTGGFPGKLRRASGELAVIGGMTPEYGEDEFAALEERGQTNGVRALALISGTRTVCPALCGPQSVIYRLSPSPERLAFVERGPRISRRVLAPFSATQRIEMYGEQVGVLLAGERAFGHRSAHMENIIAGDFGADWQDWADAVPLYPSRADHFHVHACCRRTVTLRVLDHTFFYVERTARLFREAHGTTVQSFNRAFYRGLFAGLRTLLNGSEPLQRLLITTKHSVPLHSGELAGLIWDEVLALQNYAWSRSHYDLPGAIFARVPTHSALRYFLRREVCFLERAWSIAKRSGESAGRNAEIAADLAAARDALRSVPEHLNQETVLLPYLKISAQSVRPRRPVS